MNFDEFKLTLKAKIKRTAPDRAGSWKRYLDEKEPELDEFVAQKCYAYLRSSEEERRQLEGFLDDDDCLWYFESFIQDQCAQAANGGREGLLLGLTTLAIIGFQSDPRDVTLWVGDCYEASKKGAISDAKALFKTVGALASPADHSGQWGWQTVSNEITMGFEAGERSDEYKRKAKPHKLPHELELSPLIEAANHDDVVRIIDLLQQGVDINAEVNGISPLAIAVFGLKERAVEILLEAGARVDIKMNGMTLLELARLGDPYGKNNVRMIQILKQHGLPD